APPGRAPTQRGSVVSACVLLGPVPPDARPFCAPAGARFKRAPIRPVLPTVPGCRRRDPCPSRPLRLAVTAAPRGRRAPFPAPLAARLPGPRVAALPALRAAVPAALLVAVLPALRAAVLAVLAVRVAALPALRAAVLA